MALGIRAEGLLRVWSMGCRGNLWRNGLVMSVVAHSPLTVTVLKAVS